MKNLTKALKIFLFFTLLTGIIYPLLITGIGQAFFYNKANGSLVNSNGKVIGSELIGQVFKDSIYFQPRPSASSYGTVPSGASNLGPTNPNLRKVMNERRTVFLKTNHLSASTDVPPEMLFASGSGLDPHISKEAALLQVSRIAKARGFDIPKTNQLRRLVLLKVEKPQFSILGEARVNVLLLNLELDKLR